MTDSITFVQAYDQTRKAYYRTTLHDMQFTHALFNGGIICPMEEVFHLADVLHKKPVMLLRDGWHEHKSTVMRHPDHHGPWLDVRHGAWVSGYSNVGDYGQLINCRVGPGHPGGQIIVSREYL